MQLNRFFLQSKKARRFSHYLEQGDNIRVRGLNNSRLNFFIGNILHKIDNQVVLVTYDKAQLNQIHEDLLRLLPDEDILVFPEIEVLPHEQIDPDIMVMKERLEVLEDVLFTREAEIVLTTSRALSYKLMPASLFKEYSLNLKPGDEINLSHLSKKLEMVGYERVDMVEQPLQFSIRGGIIDIFTLSNEHPYRLELFGDEIDSIRVFDQATQRSCEDLKKVVIPPAREIIINSRILGDSLGKIEADFKQGIQRLQTMGKQEEAEYLSEKRDKLLEQLRQFQFFPGYEQFLPYYYEQPGSFFEYIPVETRIFYDHPERVWQRLHSFHRDLQENQATLLEQGSVLPSYSRNFLEPGDFSGTSESFTSAYFGDQLKNVPIIRAQKDISFETRGVEPYHGQLELFVERVSTLIERDYRVLVTLNSESKADRIGRFLEDRGLTVTRERDRLGRGRVVVISGSFAEGFILEDVKLAVFTENEVIGKRQKKKREISDFEEGVKISSLNELETGDYVVHENHGIGKYLGVKTLEIQNRHQDYLVIKYAGEDKLYVPTEKVHLVQKYIGADSTPPRLYKLGGNEWKKVKQRVQDSVKEMAIGLLELYAEREATEGYAFSEDSEWQREFDDDFPYEETPDQLEAIRDVKRDMESPQPMDRLLCGDVGYGKTEVAIRAAFKAAVDGKQTAVLVPTTILAQQHYNTFKERINKYPITVEMLSRFKTPGEQKEIIKKLATGRIDIIIGTHRLLSEDIVFDDLGLLVIDEEQRFGVQHKERLKDLKRNVDVLTLTATPIPRTLHMALVGVRDMSVIETPPKNRYPIRTYIREFDEELIKDALRKELAREGQVYFVHNRVEDIEEKADLVRQLVPEARVAVAHGQMNERHLEQLMYDFYNQEYDVLVCTTIIENGLDIPMVNTIIINRADNMGLAQLYQLRGRVGRSDRVAYAYLLYKQDRVLSEVAEKRLRAIKEFTNLGSGFKIAMRDLEIRGAGNLLGPEQHGHIASIGFSLYCKLLEGAVEELKGEKEEEEEVEVDLEVDAYIPDDYIPDSRQKIEVYKKVRDAGSLSRMSDIIEEIIDRFGDPPQPVINLINSGKARIKARRLGIEKIEEKDILINCHFRDMDYLEGKSVVDLVDAFPRKIKVRSGKKPIISIKTRNENSPDFLNRVLDKLLELISIN